MPLYFSSLKRKQDDMVESTTSRKKLHRDELAANDEMFDGLENLSVHLWYLILDNALAQGRDYMLVLTDFFELALISETCFASLFEALRSKVRAVIHHLALHLSPDAAPRCTLPGSQGPIVALSLRFVISLLVQKQSRSAEDVAGTGLAHGMSGEIYERRVERLTLRAEETGWTDETASLTPFAADESVHVETDSTFTNVAVSNVTTRGVREVSSDGGEDEGTHTHTETEDETTEADEEAAREHGPAWGEDCLSKLRTLLESLSQVEHLCIGRTRWSQLGVRLQNQMSHLSSLEIPWHSGFEVAHMTRLKNLHFYDCKKGDCFARVRNDSLERLSLIFRRSEDRDDVPPSSLNLSPLPLLQHLTIINDGAFPTIEGRSTVLQTMCLEQRSSARVAPFLDQHLSSTLAQAISLQELTLPQWIDLDPMTLERLRRLKVHHQVDQECEAILSSSSLEILSLHCVRTSLKRSSNDPNAETNAPARAVFTLGKLPKLSDLHIVTKRCLPPMLDGDMSTIRKVSLVVHKSNKRAIKDVMDNCVPRMKNLRTLQVSRNTLSEEQLRQLREAHVELDYRPEESVQPDSAAKPVSETTANEEERVKFVTHDEQEILLSRRAAGLPGSYLQSLCEDTSEKGREVITIPFEANVVQPVLQWLEEYAELGSRIDEKYPASHIFWKRLDTIPVAVFLSIDVLLEKWSSFWVRLTRGKTTENYRRMFTVTNPMSREDEDKHRKQNPLLVRKISENVSSKQL